MRPSKQRLHHHWEVFKSGLFFVDEDRIQSGSCHWPTQMVGWQHYLSGCITCVALNHTMHRVFWKVTFKDTLFEVGGAFVKYHCFQAISRLSAIHIANGFANCLLPAVLVWPQATRLGSANKRFFRQTLATPPSLSWTAREWPRLVRKTIGVWSPQISSRCIRQFWHFQARTSH